MNDRYRSYVPAIKNQNVTVCTMRKYSIFLHNNANILIIVSFLNNVSDFLGNIADFTFCMCFVFTFLKQYFPQKKLFEKGTKIRNFIKGSGVCVLSTIGLVHGV